MGTHASHFRQAFLAYCTRPVRVHLAMACIGCSFNSLFAQFKTTTKSHENYVFLYPFSSMAISHQFFFFFKKYYILVNWMGWQVCQWGMGGTGVRVLAGLKGYVSWFQSLFVLYRQDLRLGYGHLKAAWNWFWGWCLVSGTSHWQAAWDQVAFSYAETGMFSFSVNKV